ncbi:hypothetical protein AAFF_G00343940 [Aldrovandia affinis]|uniref:Uncharacterized protein n=1 Tax=Aldrovandia affinis TaxID=143900 RepID=A0AAD7SK03_9TELE|nr:hypothetical protein AAFF_G00343940 [Aldrovandia affinis]
MTLTVDSTMVTPDAAHGQACGGRDPDQTSYSTSLTYLTPAAKNVQLHKRPPPVNHQRIEEQRLLRQLLQPAWPKPHMLEEGSAHATSTSF